MCGIVAVKRIRFKDHPNARKVTVGLNQICKHLVQCLAAARFGRCLHHRIDTLTQPLPRLFDRGIAADHRTNFITQLIVLCTCARFEQLIISPVPDERDEDRHHDDNPDECDRVQLKADTPSPFLSLFLQNILSFPQHPAIPTQNEAPLAITVRKDSSSYCRRKTTLVHNLFNSPYTYFFLPKENFICVIRMIRTKAATAHTRCFCMRNLPAPDSVAHGVGRTTNFLGNLGRRPAIAESCLDDDSFFECEVCSFAMRRFCDTL